MITRGVVLEEVEGVSGVIYGDLQIGNRFASFPLRRSRVFPFSASSTSLSIRQHGNSVGFYFNCSVNVFSAMSLFLLRAQK